MISKGISIKNIKNNIVVELNLRTVLSPFNPIRFFKYIFLLRHGKGFYGEKNVQIARKIVKITFFLAHTNHSVN